MKRIGFVCLFAWLLLLVCPAAAQQNQQKLTNKDVVKMVKASLPGDVIVQTIRSSTPDFDVSADGLIALKQDGVPDPIIQAMVARATAPAMQPTQSVSPDLAQGGTANRNVFLIDAAKRVQMRRASPTGGSSGGAMKMLNPFGKINILDRFSGKHALLHTSNPSPVFEASIESDLNPSDSILLVKLSQKSDTREISIAGGRIGASTGVDKDDKVPISIAELPAQTSGSSLRTYRIGSIPNLLKVSLDKSIAPL